jgi:hypothetical protein
MMVLNRVREATGSQQAPRKSETNSTGIANGVPQTKEGAAETAAPQTKRKKATLVRPEEAGEDFSLLESSEVVRRLTQSNERIAERKAAKVLGDRYIAGNLKVSQGEQQAINGYVEKQVGLTAAAAGQDRVEANDQIRRLWRLSADKLIDSLGCNNVTIVEAAIKNLALMRDEDIVRKIIGRIEASNSAAFRKYAIMALGMMKEKRDCLVPDRHTLGDDESEALAKKLIIPFLTRLKETEKDADILNAIKMAFQFLEHPTDARLRPNVAK